MAPRYTAKNATADKIRGHVKLDWQLPYSGASVHIIDLAFCELSSFFSKIKSV